MGAFYKDVKYDRNLFLNTSVLWFHIKNGCVTQYVIIKNSTYFILFYFIYLFIYFFLMCLEKNVKYEYFKRFNFDSFHMLASLLTYHKG